MECNEMSDNQDKRSNDKAQKKDFLEWRPLGIPKRYILAVIWGVVTIATWFITNDARKTMVAAIGTPFIAGFGLFFLGMMCMVGGMILFCINEFFNDIIPQKCRKMKWYVLVPLWVALPLYTLIARGSVQGAFMALVAVPILVFCLLWFVGVFGSWIVAACEVKNPILKIIAIIGVLLAIGFIIAIAVTSKGGGYDDYDQYDRGDPTYFRRR